MGRIVHTARRDSRFRPGDQVIVISTDYRDERKAAYQDYVVSLDFNTVRLPRTLSPRAGATVGVAYVAAALALGVCLGVDFGATAKGPDLRALVARAAASRPLPDDVRDECAGVRLQEGERARAGDWLVVGGGSSTTAGVALQLARLAGLRVALVVDAAKHGLRLAAHPSLRPDLLIDAHDPARAVAVLRRNFGRRHGRHRHGRHRLLFALDTRSRDSAAVLARALGPGAEDEEDGDSIRDGAGSSRRLTPPATPTGDDKTRRAHLVGLSGLPREPETHDLIYHMVPIKLYHEVREVGEALSLWLERLLDEGLLTTPDIVAVEAGFDGINRGLDRMRSGEVSGGKAIVVLDDLVPQAGNHDGLSRP